MVVCSLAKLKLARGVEAPADHQPPRRCGHDGITQVDHVRSGKAKSNPGALDLARDVIPSCIGLMEREAESRSEEAREGLVFEAQISLGKAYPNGMPSRQSSNLHFIPSLIPSIKPQFTSHLPTYTKDGFRTRDSHALTRAGRNRARGFLT